MHFVAQIDLAEVAREAGPTLLPPDGSFAFFMAPATRPDGDWQAAVVHVPRSASREPTAPPSDAPAVLEAGNEIFPRTADPSAPRLFARWPVDITALDADPPTDPEDEEDASLIAAVEKRFTRREFFFTASEAFKLLGDAPKPFWWHSAHHYAACLRPALRGLPHLKGVKKQFLDAERAKLGRLRPSGVLRAFAWLSKLDDRAIQKAEANVTRLGGEIAELERLTPDFARFAQEAADWVRSKDPWQPMLPGEVDALRAMFERGKSAFGEFTRHHTPFSIKDLHTETLLALATADDRAYATMPAAVRGLLNSEYLLPTRGWHQMFGRGVDIQGHAVWANEGNVLLLQLVYDDMMHWRFGDMGAFQFWISPADLAKRNWAAVNLTFECH